MTAQNLQLRFEARMRELLVMLPYDLKVLFAVMTDANLSLEARQLATGAVIYCLSPSDPIPDSMGVVGFADDVVVVRLSLARLQEMSEEGFSDYPTRFGEQFAPLDDDITLLREYLGESVGWVDDRLGRLHEMKYKGQTVTTYVSDEEMGQRLYEEGLAFTTDYEIDEETATKLSGEAVLEAFTKVFKVENQRKRQ
ncbi:MAG: DUF1232 domain-containing protein [Deltaproteobacteria bacterium]|nr:DUF1232 domain-containing protein [Deltaproteobacteria bacterium]